MDKNKVYGVAYFAMAACFFAVGWAGSLPFLYLLGGCLAVIGVMRIKNSAK